MGASSSTHGHPPSAATPTCDHHHQHTGHHGLMHAHSWSSLHDHVGHDGHFGGSVKSEVTAAVKKKRNLASLVTLKKRLVRRARRASKTFDHGQILRDFLTGWSTHDLLLLVEEYEGTGLLKELSFQAEIARPSASTVARDLAELYDFKYVADTYLLFRGVHFPVHKAIICVRCPFFRELLGKVNTFGAQISVSLDIPGLRPELFNDLLRYLYSGQLTPTMPPDASPPPSLPSYDSVLLRLSEQFGVPNDLDYDLKRLLETGLYSDASLVFSSSTSSTPSDFPLTGLKKCRACSDQAEYSCHSAVLASRSPFFKNVIQRHQRRITDASGQSDPPTINTANQKIRIVLDESIIPRRYARVILHAMYRDNVDLVAVLPLCVCKCYQYNLEQNSGQPMPGHPSDRYGGGGSTTSIGSSVAGSSNCSTLGSFGSLSSSNCPAGTPASPASFVREIMDLFEIARFLELDSLIQSCEDMMMESLSVDTLVLILKWSEQPHGSPWVKRQALNFLREEFATVAAAPVLFNLEHSHLLEAVKSDYLQASELEVLQSVIKWAEHRLARRMEEREPNIVSQTAHSLRRNLRKRELNDVELRDILSELMGHIRIGHILPLDCDALTSAAKRGLISTLPPYMLGEDLGVPYVRGISSWLRGRGSGPFANPRFFTPYVEEAKSYLEERLGRPGEMIPRRDLGAHRGITHIPDTLYMLDHQKESMDGVSHHHGGGGLFRSSQSETGYGYCRAQEIGGGCGYQQEDESVSCAERAVGREVASSAAGSVGGSQSQLAASALPVIEQRILVLMKQREQELKTLALSNRALALVGHRTDITKLIQLRTVREFGLPDGASEVLTNTASYMPYPVTETTDTCTDEMTASYGMTGIGPSSGVLSNLGSNGALASDKDNIYCCAGEVRLDREDSPIPPMPHPSEAYGHYDFEEEYMGGRHNMSGVMPDIAMATSALAELHLFKRSTESLARQPPPPQRPTNFEGRY